MNKDIDSRLTDYDNNCIKHDPGNLTREESTGVTMESDKKIILNIKNKGKDIIVK